MNIRSFLLLLLTLVCNHLFAQIQLGNLMEGSYGHEMGRSVSLSKDGRVAATSSYAENENTGCVRIFEWKDSTWKTSATLCGGKEKENFGFSIALSANGKRLAVGAIGAENDPDLKGYVRVFEFNGTQWQQIGQDIIGDAALYLSGWVTALSETGNTLAISSPQYSSSPGNVTMEGMVKVYQFKNSSWQQLGNTIYGAPNTYTGQSLTMSSDGTVLAMGSKYEHDVKIYKLQTNTWTSLGIIKEFGYSIALSEDGKKIAIGNPLGGTNEHGTVKIFVNTGKWVQQGETILGKERDQYGVSLSLSGNGKVLAIGIRRHTAQSAICVLYVLKDTKWIKRGNLISLDKDVIYYETFVTLSKDGTRVITGTPEYNKFHGRVGIFDIRNIQY